MQLHIVEAVVVDTGDDVLGHIVDEDTHTGHVGRLLHRSRAIVEVALQLVEPLTAVVGHASGARAHHLHVAWRLGIEHHAYHVGAQVLDGCDILGIGHAAYFDNHSLYSFNGCCC